MPSALLLLALHGAHAQPVEGCAAGDLLSCMAAVGEASKERAWAAVPGEPLPVVERYAFEVLAERACLLGESALCGFEPPSGTALWSLLPDGWSWLPGTPLALPGGGWTTLQGEALGFVGHRVIGAEQAVGTAEGLVFAGPGGVVRVGPMGPAPLDALPTPRMPDGSSFEVREDGVRHLDDGGAELTAWALELPKGARVVPHFDGHSIAVVHQGGSLLIPLLPTMGTVEDVPEGFPEQVMLPGASVPAAGPRVEIAVPAWTRSVCELSVQLPYTPTRRADAVRVGVEALSLPDEPRRMPLIATSSPAGCTDVGPRGAAHWPPEAEQLAILGPDATAFREVNRRVLRVVDELGRPVIGLPVDVKGKLLSYTTTTDLWGKLVWWDPDRTELRVHGWKGKLPMVREDRLVLPAAPGHPKGKDAAPETLAGVWKPSDPRVAWTHLSREDVVRGWAVATAGQVIHIAATKKDARVLQCHSCETPVFYERVAERGSLSDTAFLGGQTPAEATAYTRTVTRPGLHRALQESMEKPPAVEITDPAWQDQPGGPMLTALTGRTLEKGQRAELAIQVKGTTYAGFVRYDGPVDCGGGRCADLLVEVNGTFSRWVVQAEPLRAWRTATLDRNGEEVEVVEVAW